MSLPIESIPVKFKDMFYTRNDEKVITFMCYSVIREYNRQLRVFPFNVLAPDHIIKSIEIQPDLLYMAGKPCSGLTHFDIDKIQMVLPHNMNTFDVSLFGRLVSHEIGHHYIEEYMCVIDPQHSGTWGNNLIHYAENSRPLYEKVYKYWSPVFARRYMIPYAQFPIYQLHTLLRRKNVIANDIKIGVAPQGDPYWSQ